MNSSTTATSTTIESLIPLVRDANTVDRSGAAATACLIYDMIISWDQEVEYIWKSAWTPPKLLYLFSRYFSLMTQICHGWTFFEAVTGQLIVLGVEISLMLRVYALYKRDRRILVSLLLLYTAEVTTHCVMLGLELNKIVSIAPLRDIFPSDFPLSGCFPTNIPAFFTYYWIPSLIFESILFILMTINVVRHVREQKGPTPLLMQFLRDGTMYYAVIFATLLANVLLYLLANSALAQVAIEWELAAFSIAGCRLILNLRATGRATCSPTGAENVTTLDVMRFDGGPGTELLSQNSGEQIQTSNSAFLEGSSSATEAFGTQRRSEGAEGSSGLDVNEKRDWISEWAGV
ncbi:hypothetical protein M0805_004627 [Coniferiporia weirii]|nr:hypothetical protein M0805_004627 [Coniferiporia weirii]